MARRYCFAPGCTSGYKSNKEKVALFKVPKDKLTEWSEVIPRIDRKLNIKDALCEKHFFKEDVIREVVTDTYSYPLKVPRLRENAKPSIWPNCPVYLTKKPANKRKSIERHDYVPKRKKKNDLQDKNEVMVVKASTSQENNNENISLNILSETKKMTDKAVRHLAVQLFKIDAIKFGEFKTKIGLMTPVYVDFRVIISYPLIMKSLAEVMVSSIKNLPKFNVICGVPYTALPFATVISMDTSIPMVMRRKEAKNYGTKKLIEGVYNEGDSCLVIEDVVTSGSSILETVADLQNNGLKCSHAVVLLNRQQGGKEFLKQRQIEMHAVFDLSKLMKILHEEKCIDEKVLESVEIYLQNNQIQEIPKPLANRLQMTYQERAKQAKNAVAADLFALMARKQTNLCLAADLTSATDILNLAEQVGPHICALKTHIDIIEDFHLNFIKSLKKIADAHNFILFEDRKFADIGKTVELQYTRGTFQISSWAQLVTAHSLTGSGVLDALKSTSEKQGVFLLAQTSAAGNLISDSYTRDTLKLAERYPDLVAGIVCQSPLFLDQPGLIQLTPGVQIELTEDSLGQRYNSPEAVVLERGGDVAVVGRGITKAKDPAAAAVEYKTLLWKAYLKRVAVDQK